MIPQRNISLIANQLTAADGRAGQGNMSIVMVRTALVLDHHGHSLWAIAVPLAMRLAVRPSG